MIGIPSTETPPLVSVLVPSYDHEKYVVDCLESIRGLDYPNLELIVSDDASPDGTFELAGKWIAENRGRFARAAAIRQPVNLGIVRNLQFLFDQAQGEYIAYLASDDCLVPSSIRCRLQVLQEDGSLDAVFGNAEHFLTDGTVLKTRFIPPHLAAQLSVRAVMLSSLILNWRVPGPVMMLRRAATLPGGSLGRLPEELQGEDEYIYTRLAALRKLAFVDTVVARWRAAPGSLSNPLQRNYFTLRYTVESDRRNRPLIHGMDRLALDVRMADAAVILQRKNRWQFLGRKFFFRACLAQLRLLLRIRTWIARRIRRRSRRGSGSRFILSRTARGPQG